MLRPGRLNLITDVAGVTVGHATDARVLSGVTTLQFDGSWSTGVDVRGGGPGLRETEVLAPENLVGRAHAGPQEAPRSMDPCRSSALRASTGRPHLRAASNRIWSNRPRCAWLPPICSSRGSTVPKARHAVS